MQPPPPTSNFDALSKGQELQKRLAVAASKTSPQLSLAFLSLTDFTVPDICGPVINTDFTVPDFSVPDTVPDIRG